ncbi:DUF6634 family protein [Pseudotabrizicola formosa]|uniref:DUF6634 family protein n=1 Tax=Pseudotabrizicola formosa TaxID=2030009 RepID=UPI0011AEDF4E|nr:DUF6634 family protein [Pseudotabrizicola formosa]
MNTKLYRDPRRPFLERAEILKERLGRPRGEDDLLAALDADRAMTGMFHQFQREMALTWLQTHRPDWHEQLEEFLAHVEDLISISPTEELLRDAPVLAKWCAVHFGGYPHLFGQVAGHPRLGDQRYIATSPYFQIDPSGTWARTWSRFYVLGAYDESTVQRAKGRRAIEEGVELIRLPV